MKEKIINAVIFVLLQVTFAVIFLVNLFLAESQESRPVSPRAPLAFFAGIQIIVLAMVAARVLYAANIFWSLVISIGVTFLLAKATILRRKAV